MKQFFLIFVTLFFIGNVSTVYPQISTDDWSVTNYGTGEYLQAIAPVLSVMYVAVGSNGNILISNDDGFHWWNDGQVAYHLQDIVCHPWGDSLVAVGSNGTILTSTFGFFWEEENSTVTNNLYAVNYGNGIFIAGVTMAGY